MNGHEVALWSAAAAFFGYLLATGLFEVLDVDRIYDYLGGVHRGRDHGRRRLLEGAAERGEGAEGGAEAELAQADALGGTCGLPRWPPATPCA